MPAFASRVITGMTPPESAWLIGTAENGSEVREPGINRANRANRVHDKLGSDPGGTGVGR